MVNMAAGVLLPEADKVGVAFDESVTVWSIWKDSMLELLSREAKAWDRSRDAIASSARLSMVVLRKEANPPPKTTMAKEEMVE
jgi:hypothetical protein